MSHVRIDLERCKACLLCIEFCPRHCLEVGAALNSRGFHAAAMKADAHCTGCRICALMCPDVCIEVYRDAQPVGKQS